VAQRTAVMAMLQTILAPESRAEAEAQWNSLADVRLKKQPEPGTLMDTSQDDVLAEMSCPSEPLEGLPVQVFLTWRPSAMDDPSLEG